jgi:putative cardiolipin synthase
MLLLAGCGALPSLADRTASVALADTAQTRLGRSALALAQAHPGRSGVFPLRKGQDAFAARALLAEAAERSLDVQSYIWRNDMSGTLLFDTLRRAADRGVRVRLLLDDNNTTSGLDAVLAALDSHRNIEVRLFNPFVQRRWRAIGFITDFARLNRRMHNKSFTADNQVTIVGGRNVGDEYFGASDEFSFVDLDVLAVGPVVSDVSRDFDRYWASASAYPISGLLPPATRDQIAAVAAAAALVRQNAAATAYVEAIAKLPFVGQLLGGNLPLLWAPTRMLSDDPAKALGRETDDELLWSRLKLVMPAPTQRIELVSAYFVPGKPGAEWLTDMARRGVEVIVLTNALEATDVVAVHAGYAKRRKALLAAGVRLFELKRMTSLPVRNERGLGGSSASSLHAKTFAVDGSSVFVGSFNFDLRSARLNTEMGFVIESAALDEAMAAALAKDIPDRAYQVVLGAGGSLQWIEHRSGQRIVHEQEPGASIGSRAYVFLLSLLPIDWLL